MNNIDMLKEKIINVLNQYQKREYTKEFEALLDELNQLSGSYITTQNNSFLNKMFNFIRTKFIKQNEPIINIEKYNEIKNKVIKLYSDKVLKEKFIKQLETRNKDFIIFNSNNNVYNKFFSQYKKYQEEKIRLKTSSNGNIEIFPWKIEENDIKSSLNEEVLKISELFFSNNITEEEAINQRTTYLEQKNEAVRNTFLQSDIEPYYGTPEFICERSEYILECMNKIISDKEVKEENKIATRQYIEETKKIVSEINKYKEDLENCRDYDIYLKLKVNFEKLLSFENMISKDIEQIWNEFLTDPKEYKEGEPYAFLVHAYSEKINELRPMNKCCCTLVTEKCMPIPYGDYGVICGFDSVNIGTMCTEDAGSWICSKEEFFDRDMPREWQFAEDVGDKGEKVWYENARVSKLILPTTMEKEMIENNIHNDGFRAYTEIFMSKGKNGENIPVQELFYTKQSGKNKTKPIKKNYHPIMIDPSKGTIVKFMDKEIKDR